MKAMNTFLLGMLNPLSSRRKIHVSSCNLVLLCTSQLADILVAGKTQVEIEFEFASPVSVNRWRLICSTVHL